MAVEIERLSTIMELEYGKYLKDIERAKQETAKRLAEIDAQFARSNAHVSRQMAAAMSASSMANQRLIAGMSGVGAASAKSAAAVRAMGASVEKTAPALRQAGAAAASFGVDIRSLAGVLGTVGTYLTARELFAYADAWKRIERSLISGEQVFGIVLDSAEDLTALANEARIDVEAYTKTYIRTAAAIRDFGYDSKIAAEVTSTLAKALKLGSASASEQASTILQFSQALQKGKLDGDEFRTVMENAGVVQELLAKRLGVTKGEIVKMAAEGKLKLRELVEAMREGKELIDRVFAGQAVTLDEAFTVLNNSVTEYIGHVDKAYGVTRKTANAVAFLARNVELIGDVALTAGVALLAMFGPSLMVRTGAFVASMTMATGGLNLVLGAATAAAVGLSLFGDDIKISKNGVVTLADGVSSLAGSMQKLNDELATNKERWEEAKKAGWADFLFESINQGMVGPLRRIGTGNADENADRRLLRDRNFGQDRFGKYLSGTLREQKIETPRDEDAERRRARFEKDMLEAKNRLAMSKLEIDALGHTTRILETNRTAQTLINEAKKAGVDLTEDDEKNILKVADAAGRLAAQMEFMSALQGKRFENEELEAEVRLLGLSGQELERARVEQELLNAAKRAGFELTPELRAEVAALAERNAALRTTREMFEGLRDEAKETFRSIAHDALSGAKASEILANALDNISAKLLDMGVNKLVDLAFGSLIGSGSGGSGGILSILGFAEGGRVRGPGTGTSDSIVARLSDGEYVVKEKSARKYGSLLDAINNDRLPKFANGGPVGVPSIPAVPQAAPAAAATSMQITVAPVFHVENGTPEGVDKLKNEMVPVMRNIARTEFAAAFDRTDGLRRMKGG